MEKTKVPRRFVVSVAINGRRSCGSIHLVSESFPCESKTYAPSKANLLTNKIYEELAFFGRMATMDWQTNRYAGAAGPAAPAYRERALSPCVAPACSGKLTCDWTLPVLLARWSSTQGLFCPCCPPCPQSRLHPKCPTYRMGHWAWRWSSFVGRPRKITTTFVSMPTLPSGFVSLVAL